MAFFRQKSSSNWRFSWLFSLIYLDSSGVIAIRQESDTRARFYKEWSKFATYSIRNSTRTHSRRCQKNYRSEILHQIHSGMLIESDQSWQNYLTLRISCLQTTNMANMEEKDKIKAGVKKMIRPLLIAAKGGVPLEKINRKNFSIII